MPGTLAVLSFLRAGVPGSSRADLMRSKLVLIIAVALLLGSSVGVLATDLSQNGCPDQAALLAASPQLLPASAPAGRVAGAADAVAPAAPRAPRGVALCCRC